MIEITSLFGVGPLSEQSISDGSSWSDVVSDLIWELRYTARRNATPVDQGFVAQVDEIERIADADDTSDEQLIDLVGQLLEIAEPFVPMYAHIVDDGNGGISVLPDIEGLRDDADLIVDDSARMGDDVPDGFTGLVMHVSDHGNVACLTYDQGKSKEHWAVV